MAATIYSISCMLTSAFVLGFTWRLYHHRQWISQLRKAGMPMPPWSFITGHVLLFYRHNRRLPRSTSVNLAFYDIASDFADHEMFLLDIWPLSEPMLVIFNPEAAIQVCQKLNLPKGEKNETMIRPITGGITFLSMNGDPWKFWRTLFNPGFSTAVLNEQIPAVVNAAVSFCEMLERDADRRILSLDDLTTRLTFEVILKVTLNADLGGQYGDHVFVRAMSNIVKWHSFWDPLVLMNPLRPFVNWYNGRIVNSWIQTELEQRYEKLKQEHQENYQGIGQKLPVVSNRVHATSVMDYAISGYVNGNQGKLLERLDTNFLTMAAHQMRLFLFAGNDSTSSTIVFTLHLLYKNVSILTRLRSEHVEIFGSDSSPSATADKLKAEPLLLNKLPLTTAVIKETLRLYAPAATMRSGDPSCVLRTGTGVPIPTAHCSILVSHHSIHRNNRLWPRADEFLPERWLVGPEDVLYPKEGAWRPFELGARACIGKSLAFNEIKIVLAMVVRHWNIWPAYEGSSKGKIWKGERAYQTEKAGAHPSEGYPCYVSRA